jgi:hypothetical protein
MGRGNINVDFAVGVALFLFALTSAFIYIHSEQGRAIDSQNIQANALTIENALLSIEKVDFEKRIIAVEGYSNSEYINISGLGAVLILDGEGNSICFDEDAGGFVADISGYEEFYIYSSSFSKGKINRNICPLESYSDRLLEKVSSPIYLRLIAGRPDLMNQGNFCEKRLLSYIEGDGIRGEFFEVCV